MLLESLLMLTNTYFKKIRYSFPIEKPFLKTYKIKFLVDTLIGVYLKFIFYYAIHY